jgi:hypothetical protein
MKSLAKKVSSSSAALVVLLTGLFQGQAQTTVSVDTTRSWIGYMNVFALNGDGTPNYGAYMFGSGWGIADLRGFFSSTNYLVLTPNTNVWNPTDPYWVNTNNQTANKWMDASFYVQDDTLAGQTVTFSGTCLTNSLVAPANSVAFIKDFVPNYSANTPVTVNLVPGQPFSITLQTTAGDHVQYGFETQGPDVAPANLVNAGSVAIAVNNADPSLSSLTSLGLVEGQNANFTITSKGTAPFTYQWTHIVGTTTNVLSNGGGISGATSSSLTISNVTLSAAGTYVVTVSNSKGSGTATGFLTVVPLAVAQTNLLVDPGFESDTFSLTPTAGWVAFNGADMQNINDYYYLSSTPVTVVGGSNCLQIYSGGPGSYNGAYQDRPASPGQVYTASAWFLTPTEDPISGSNVCYLEVQFRDAGDNPLVQYATGFVDTNFPNSTWTMLVPTNIHAGNFTTPLGTASYMVAPPNTAKARFQFTYHAVDAAGSVYVDDAVLQLREPVVTLSASGSNIHISFPTLYGPNYQVYYKNSLTDSTWHPLGGTIPGDGTVKTVPDPSGSLRFYTVNAVY